MVKSMLDFDSGKKIWHCLDSNGNVIQTLCICDDKDHPDIMVDNILPIISNADINIVKVNMKLTPLEIKFLKRAIKSGLEEDVNKFTDRLKIAFNMLKEVAQNRLKTEIHFGESDDIRSIVPVIGHNKFDRSIFISGPSGSGKSFLAKNIIKHDLKARPIIVFSKIEDDESLSELKKLKVNKSSFRDQHDGGSRMIKMKLDTQSDLLDLPSNHELKNTVCLFDDINSFPKETADFLNHYRDTLLECGRHQNITVISTSHQVHDWSKTRTALNECQYTCLFPHSSKFASAKFLSNRMGLRREQCDNVLDTAMNAGRFLICRNSAPNLIMHEKGVILL